MVVKPEFIWERTYGSNSVKCLDDWKDGWRFVLRKWFLTFGYSE